MAERHAQCYMVNSDADRVTRQRSTNPECMGFTCGYSVTLIVQSGNLNIENRSLRELCLHRLWCRSGNVRLPGWFTPLRGNKFIVLLFFHCLSLPDGSTKITTTNKSNIMLNL